MSSLKQLEQQKAQLEIKINQSIESAKKVELELHRARERQQAVDRCSSEINLLLENHGLRLEDILPEAATGHLISRNQAKKSDGFFSLFGVKPERKYKHIVESLKLKKI